MASFHRHVVLFWYKEMLYSNSKTNSIEVPRKEADGYGLGDEVQAKYQGKLYPAIIVGIGGTKKELEAVSERMQYLVATSHSADEVLQKLGISFGAKGEEAVPIPANRGPAGLRDMSEGATAKGPSRSASDLTPPQPKRVRTEDARTEDRMRPKAPFTFDFSRKDDRLSGTSGRPTPSTKGVGKEGKGMSAELREEVRSLKEEVRRLKEEVRGLRDVQEMTGLKEEVLQLKKELCDIIKDTKTDIKQALRDTKEDLHRAIKKRRPEQTANTQPEQIANTQPEQIANTQPEQIANTSMDTLDTEPAPSLAINTLCVTPCNSSVTHTHTSATSTLPQVSSPPQTPAHAPSSHHLYNGLTENDLRGFVASCTDGKKTARTLARKMFTTEQLINCSFTGKPTTQNNFSPKPALDGRYRDMLLKLTQETVPGTPYSVVYAAVSNVQKVLRQQQKKAELK